MTVPSSSDEEHSEYEAFPPGSGAPGAVHDEAGGLTTPPGYGTMGPASPAPPEHSAPQYGPPQYAPPGYGPPQYGPPGYGSPQYASPGYYAHPPMPYHPVQPTNTYALVSLILGIVSLPFVLVLSWVTGPLAVVFGFLGLQRVRRGEAGQKGMAVAGIVLGALSVAVTLLMVLVFVAAY